MKEKFLEDVVVKYPTLIEPGLVFIQRQIPLNNGKRRIDLLYQDKNGNKLFVELKRRKFRREDIRQIIEYYKHIKLANDPTIRLMVIATGFCPEAKLILRYLGIELKKSNFP